MTVRKNKKRNSLWTNADLLECFDLFARKYFDNKLRRPAKVSFFPLDGLGHTFRYRTVGHRRSQYDPFGIHISNKLRYSRRLWATTLLHEMVHLEQRNKYSCRRRGRKFNARMKELARLGAFDGLW